MELKIKIDEHELIREATNAANNRIKEAAKSATSARIRSLLYGDDRIENGKRVTTPSIVEHMVNEEVDKEFMSPEMVEMIRAAVKEAMPLAIKDAAQRRANHLAGKIAFEQDPTRF